MCVLTRVLQAMTTAHTVHVEVCNPAYSDLLMKSDLKRKTSQCDLVYWVYRSGFIGFIGLVYVLAAEHQCPLATCCYLS